MHFPISLGIAALLSVPTFAAPEASALERPDGSSVHYTLDRPAGAQEGLLLLSQGSGCAPGATNESIATVRLAFPNYAALIVEKTGVTPDANIIDDRTDCPPDYVAHYTFSQRVEDYRLVLRQLQSDPSLKVSQLVLFGGSEGGLAIAKLAAEFHPMATILLSSATGTTFGEMVRATVPPEGHATVDAGFAAARSNPDSSEMLFGHTYRFWADILDVTTLDFMRQTSSPFLLIQGGLDPSNPVAAARLTADTFATEGRCNLTYWEFSTLDHGMRMPDGTSRLAAVTALAAQWVSSPLPAC